MSLILELPLTVLELSVLHLIRTSGIENRTLPQDAVNEPAFFQSKDFLGKSLAFVFCNRHALFTPSECGTIILFAVISGLRHGARCTAVGVRRFISGISPTQRLRIAKLAVEYFNEAAVLVLVFPLLDVIVQYGVKSVSARLVFGSVAISVILFILGAILSLIEP